MDTTFQITSSWSTQLTFFTAFHMTLDGNRSVKPKIRVLHSSLYDSKLILDFSLDKMVSLH